MSISRICFMIKKILNVFSKHIYVDRLVLIKNRAINGAAGENESSKRVFCLRSALPNMYSAILLTKNLKTLPFSATKNPCGLTTRPWTFRFLSLLTVK